MGRKIKKGTRGIAAQHLSRGSALKKLQLSLADFRRLCILKGIYPRDPKKKPKGKDKTYYHTKDIVYLQHEPLLQRFRDISAFEKKYRRAVGRRELSTARSLDSNRPLYSLFHLVKERYCTLLDAIRDLDDALSTIALFASLPSNVEKSISAKATIESERLLNEFFSFISKKHLIRKVFCSIKGFYIQINYLGQAVTFLLPHRFPQDLPPEVDFKVMLTFLEFYQCLLKSINFKVYQMAGWNYPPHMNPELLKAGCAFLSSLVDPSVTSNKMNSDETAVGKSIDEVNELARNIQEQHGSSEDSDDDDDNDDEETNSSLHDSDEDTKETVKKHKKQHETYPEILENDDDNIELDNSAEQNTLLWKDDEHHPLNSLFSASCGAQEIGWQGQGTPFEEEDKRVTHHVIDRTILSEATKRLEGTREFIQPQWIFDCINAQKLLPIASYRPGASLPPHLSPFVDELNISHVPQQRVELQAIDSDIQREEKALLLANDDDDIEDIEAEEQLHQREINQEVNKVNEPIETPHQILEEEKAKEKERSIRKQNKLNSEEKERRKALLSKKHKRLLERIEYGHQQKELTKNKLNIKRKNVGKI